MTKAIDSIGCSTALYAVGVDSQTIYSGCHGKPFSMEFGLDNFKCNISGPTFQQVFPIVDLQPSSVKLHAYSGESISFLGQLIVIYLVHHIDAQGLHPVEEKIKSLLEVPAPTNVTMLKGMVTYHIKFFPICQQSLLLYIKY